MCRELIDGGFDLKILDGIETLNIGAYACPRCGSSDRDRIYSLFIADTLRDDPGAEPLSLLDIAPAPSLSRWLRSRALVNYRSADLMDPSADDRVDITDMRIYQSETFDALICSHVLEHVNDDAAAMREMYRVLRPGGWAIVMVPLSSAVTRTREDPDLIKEPDRIRLFGQRDHVRWYSQEDFERRLESAGFNVERLKASELSYIDCAASGLQDTAVLWVARRPA